MHSSCSTHYSTLPSDIGGALAEKPVCKHRIKHLYYQSARDMKHAALYRRFRLQGTRLALLRTTRSIRELFPLCKARVSPTVSSQGVKPCIYYPPSRYYLGPTNCYHFCYAWNQLNCDATLILNDKNREQLDTTLCIL